VKLCVFYEIPDASRSQFEKTENKADWYEIMGTRPMNLLFTGELQTTIPAGDPNVAFLGSKLVGEISDTLKAVKSWHPMATIGSRLGCVIFLLRLQLRKMQWFVCGNECFIFLALKELSKANIWVTML